MVRFRHVAATPLGARVRAWAYLRQIRGRRLVFDVSAYDEWDKISEGENVQLIVSLEKFLERTQQKHQQIGEKST
jgi:predicted thioesterase